MKIRLFVVALMLLLAGCKTELYSGLNENEANQMVALLLYNNIPAAKEMNKEGVALTVDESQFVNAVEILRQNGLPRRKIVTMEDLFPSGQMVSSPEQEAAKLTYLKSQQLEKMISSMEGVVAAEVSVAEPHAYDGQPNTEQVTASVFVKYSPGVDMRAHAAEIRSLVLNGIPGLSADHISVILQRANYRYHIEKSNELGSAKDSWLWAVVVALLVIMMGTGFWWWRSSGSK